MNYREIKESVLTAFIQRNNPGIAAGKSTTDAWHDFLKSQTGTDGSLSDLEKRWLHSEGAAGESLTELWGNYLNGLGTGGVGLADRLRSFFSSSSVSVTFRILNEDGTGLLTEDAAGVLLQQ